MVKTLLFQACLAGRNFIFPLQSDRKGDVHLWPSCMLPCPEIMLSGKSPFNVLSHILLQPLYCWVNSHLRCCRADVAHRVFYVVLQVNFLSSFPHVKGITDANSIANDVVGLLLASIHSDDIWSSLQLLE